MKRWLECWLPLVDHIYITDTGSTDSTLEIIKSFDQDKITILHFDWIKDFAAARNHALPFIKEDYFLWADGDDDIGNREEFIKWRDTIMYMADMWLINYNYAQHPDGKTACSFMRERVFKNHKGFKFSYFLHEGVQVSQPGINVNQCPAWEIKHLRTLQDIEKDKGRNLSIFKHHEDIGTTFDPRMNFYYGKEFFDAMDMENAIKYLARAAAAADLDFHDRILTMQYFSIALFKTGKYSECVQMAQQGLILAPSRAEFYVVIGDCYITMGRVADAIPSYSAATKCVGAAPNGFGSFIFSHETAYGHYPLTQLARAFLHLQRFDEARNYAAEADSRFRNPETQALLKELDRVKKDVFSFKDARPFDDIVFTCLSGMYEWDEKIYKERHVGGSETSTIQLAKWFKKIYPARRVIVFNPRGSDLTCDSGVEYLRADKMQVYFSHIKPSIHFAWRHTTKLTDARTIVISHDLFTPGSNQMDYEKYLCLSEFHKNYVNTVHNVPDNKIYLSRNGIVPENWPVDMDRTKNPNKMIYASSWDRGLDRCINVLDIVRGEFPDLELHVFYGADNMKAQPGPMKDLAERLEGMILDRPWIKNHGGVKQSALHEHYKDAALLVYPLNFIETFCLTILETLACGVFPIVRAFGAVTSTLGPYADRQMGELVPFDAGTIEETLKWAEIVKGHIRAKSWEKVRFDLEPVSWESVAREMIEDLKF